MEKLKKIFFLSLIFIILSIFTVYNYEDPTKNTKEAISFEITNKDNQLHLNGTFPNENDLKPLLNAWKIDKQVNVKFDDKTAIDSLLLEKLKPFIEEFKTKSLDNAKITYNTNGLNISGSIKDEESLASLKNLINKNNITANLNLEVIVKDEKAITKEIEDVKYIVEQEKKDAVVEVVKPTINDIQEQINAILLKNKITFASAGTDLSPESIKTIETISELLKNSDYNIEVSGHTDSKGNPKLNQQLSDKRAASVKNSLIKLGIDKNTIKSFGYGNQFPIAQEDELGLSEENRRVEILLKEKEGK